MRIKVNNLSGLCASCAHDAAHNARGDGVGYKAIHTASGDAPGSRME
jgi:hypothetical protein